MNFCLRLVCLLTASLMAIHALSQDLSGWSDKTLCRLASSQQDDPQYLQEATERGISCGNGATKSASKASKNSTKQQASKSIFISDKTYSDFLNLPKESKVKSCGFEWFKPNWNKINKDLAPRIKGFNSRMDNYKTVEGDYSRNVRDSYLESITYAMVSEDLELKEKLFNKLHHWASKDALSATMQCYSNGPQSIRPACEGEWSDPEGQDLAPIKDATVMIEIVMSLNYVYKLYFSDYQPEDKRHEVIKRWFKSFNHRIKKAKDFYFGNFIGFYLPNISIKHSQNKNYKSMVKKMVKGLDKWTFDDGSLKELTTRGNKALWYHHRGIGEAFIIMEIARTINVDIPVRLEKKLLKAVELFHDTYLDHSVIEPWAKKAHNSQPSNGRQKFPSLDWVSSYSSWFNIFQLRYPEHRTAKWLNKTLTSKSMSLKIAENTGVTLGCIHKALADNSPEGLAKKEAKQIEATSQLSIFKIEGETLNLALDKADFIEVRPFVLERSEEYLQPYQLHKSKIQGSLRLGGNKKISFSTLVFKQAGDQEQRLVINVDSRSLQPFKRHSDSLQKKCGKGLMEWGWLSFISETNDIENAKNQQCHYDYFKDANDKPAWELFQTVLGGTDSILGYLQTNVER
jgi:hypothetical protein